MEKKRTKSNAGRPKIEIDKGWFESLCAIQATLPEIACALNCSDDTIERFCKREYGKNFAEVFKEKRQKGLISLRRAQFQLAQKNVAMAIFLGKNYLGQKDARNIDAEVSANIKSAGNPFANLTDEQLRVLATMSEEDVKEKLAKVK